jgi:hypothetical protein
MSRSGAGSRIALTFRRWRGRFGISAPKVAVRTYVPWHLRLASVAGIVAILAMLSGWAYDAGRRIAGFDQSETSSVVSELRSSNISLEGEVAALRSLLAASESSLQIERAAQGQLSERNSVLALENAKLKEDLAVFERLSRLEDRPDDEISIDRLVVRPDAAMGRYYFSFLVALQGARRGKESALDMQLVVAPRSGSADAKMTFPKNNDSNAAQYKIALRNFRRIEGTFDLPEGYPLGTVDVRIFERGLLKVSKSVSL